MNLCPEEEYRANLTDEEFWSYVLTGQRPEEIDNYAFEEPEQESDCTTVPCTTCGSLTACGYDSEGRPMIHVVEESEDDS